MANYILAEASLRQPLLADGKFMVFYNSTPYAVPIDRVALRTSIHGKKENIRLLSQGHVPDDTQIPRALVGIRHDGQKVTVMNPYYYPGVDSVEHRWIKLLTKVPSEALVKITLEGRLN
jgi:hypothetical protein